MEKFLNLIEGVALGMAGLVIGGWVVGWRQGLLIGLSTAVAIGSVALFFYPNSRDTSGDRTE